MNEKAQKAEISWQERRRHKIFKNGEEDKYKKNKWHK